ncbi:TonB-dependent siderophore receptor [Paracoccus kondratievae]|uniref:TonB-dependent siderophore receptor n=1 Tax=Paracoccus kondratievae TaxID=135740 RepID=UPI0012665A35|nr:TonB-dependent siderophore receptor [Paracoccus kondratievae]QFQ88770.1 TonB-dependent siderophore receptor [Paracoccus kondratievae]
MVRKTAVTSRHATGSGLKGRRLLALLLLSTVFGGVLPFNGHEAYAQQAANEAVSFRIPAQPLSSAIDAFIRQSGWQISYSSALVRGKMSPGVNGNIAPRSALQRLVAGTGISVSIAGAGSAALVDLPGVAVSIPDDGAIVLDPIVIQSSGESAWGAVPGIVATRSATGTKTDAPLIEVPQSISVIAADEIRQRGAESVKDAVRYSAGVGAGGASSSLRSFDNIEVRGFAPTPLYLDGTYLPYIGDSGGSPQIDPYLLERVEVLKGPSSVLYGQNYPGGMVNMVSKRPTETPLREVIVGSGSHDRAYAAFDFSGPVPRSRDFSFRFTGVATRTGTNIDYTNEKRVMIAPSLTWKPQDGTELTILTHFQKDSGRPDYRPLPYVGTVVSSPLGYIDKDFFSGELDYNNYDRKQSVIGYDFRHEFSDRLSLHHSAKYIYVDDSYKTFFSNGYVTTDGVTDYTMLNRNAYDYASKNTVFAADTNLQLNLKAGEVEHNAIVGVDYKWFKNDYWGYYGWGNTPISITNPQYGTFNRPVLGARWDNRISQLGFYAQDQIKWDKWVLTLGGRYDIARQEDHDTMNSVETEKTNREFTYRAGLTYLFDNGLAPYASYATSFMPYSGFDGNQNPFKPTTGQQYEIGVKYQPAGQNAFISLSAYDLKQQNVPSWDQLGVAHQTGEIHVRGVELEAKATLLDSLDIIAAASYTDSVYSETEDDTQGNKVRYMPPVSASLWAKYNFHTGPFAGLGVGAGVRYSGSGYGDDANSFKYPSYTVFDANLSYEFGSRNPDLDGLLLNVTATNLFDRRYVSGCSYLNGCFYGQGRTIAANLNYRF